MDKFFSKEEIKSLLEQYPFFQNQNKEFVGASPPDIFIGEYGYPKVNVGIISPPEIRSVLSSPEEWYKNHLNIKQILTLRAQLINSRFKSNIKESSKNLGVLQEIVMSKKPAETEFHLNKKPKMNLDLSNKTNPIANNAELKKVIPRENIKIERRVEYITRDTDLKSIDALIDLYNHKTEITKLNNILSAGLLGLKNNRKLVPSKWSITATDDTISKHQIEQIKSYNHIDTIQLFQNNYVGNYYYFILFPRNWSYEIIEKQGNLYWQDEEINFKRKSYAYDVTGGYYAVRLAITEYLTKIKQQASVLVLRNITEEYYAPLGVGILRELSREAFNQQPIIFETKENLFQYLRTKISLSEYLIRSKLLKELKQPSLLKFF